MACVGVLCNNRKFVLVEWLNVLRDSVRSANGDLMGGMVCRKDLQDGLEL